MLKKMLLEAMMKDLGIRNHGMMMDEMISGQEKVTGKKTPEHILANAKLHGLKAAAEATEHYLLISIAGWSETVKEKDNKIKRLESEMERRISALQKDFAGTEKTISKLIAEKAEQGGKIHALRSKVKKLQAELDATKEKDTKNDEEEILDLTDEITISEDDVSALPGDTGEVLHPIN